MTTVAVTELTACCAAPGGQLLSMDMATRLAGMLKALADPTRLRLVSMLSAAAPEAVCVCEMVRPVGVSQPTVSHHLKVLSEAGVVTREQRGRWAYYRLVPGTLSTIAAALQPESTAAASTRPAMDSADITR